MRHGKVWLLAGLWLAQAAAVFAAPGLINYQGRLTDANGKPIATARNVTFTFWDAASGGAQLASFTDTDAVTPDANGIYSTMIGDDPGNLLPEAIFAGDNVWLNVQVGSENLVPRKRVTSVGYALNAGHAQNAGLLNDMQLGRGNFIAAEALQAGDIVLLNDAGQVQRADCAGWNHKARFSQNCSQSIATLIGPNKFVICYKTSDSAPKGEAVVGTIDGALNVTYGTPVQFASYVSEFSTAKLDTDEALVVFQDGYGVPINGKVLTATGTSLSLGPKALLTGESTTVYGFSAAPLGKDKALVAANVVDGSLNGQALVVTSTADMLTSGSTFTFNAGNTDPIRTAQLDVNKALIAFRDITTLKYMVLAATASGNTLSFGGKKTLGDAPDGSVYPVGLGTNKALVAYNSNGNRAVVLTASGATLTTGSSVSLGSVAVGPLTQMAPDKCFMASSGVGMIGMASGMTVSFGAPISLFTTFGNNLFPLGLSPSAVLLTYAAYQSGNVNWGYSRVLTDADQGDNPDLMRIIGVAEASVAAGASCPVTFTGGVTSQFSGLVPGKLYRASEDGIFGDSTFFRLGQALGTGKLVISTGQ